MRKSTKFLGALAVAGLVAAGGSAYTDSNIQPGPQTVGYGTTDVTGATVSSMAYTLNGTGTNVDSVALVLAGDTSAHAVSIGFNDSAISTCGTGTVTWTTAPVAFHPAGADAQVDPEVAAVPGVGGLTTYACAVTGQTTLGLSTTHVVVNN